MEEGEKRSGEWRKEEGAQEIGGMKNDGGKGGMKAGRKGGRKDGSEVEEIRMKAGNWRRRGKRVEER